VAGVNDHSVDPVGVLEQGAPEQDLVRTDWQLGVVAFDCQVARELVELLVWQLTFNCAIELFEMGTVR